MLANVAHNVLSSVFVLYAAYRYGDTDAGEAALARLTARAPKFAPAQLVASQLANEDGSRPPRLAR